MRSLFFRFEEPWFFLDEKGVPVGVMVSVVRLL